MRRFYNVFEFTRLSLIGLRQERNRSLSAERTSECRSKSCSPTKTFKRNFISKRKPTLWSYNSDYCV